MSAEKKHIEPSKQPAIWLTSFFLGGLVALGLISLLAKSGGVSVTENRPLTPIPQFSVWSLFSGTYTDSLELYYADNFPMRDGFVNAAISIRDLSGYHAEITYYQPETVVEEVVAKVDTVARVSVDTLAKQNVDTTTVKAEFARSAGVLVYDDRAIQLFTANSEAAMKYAEMVNLYQSTFDSLDIFCLTAPTPIDFYLPDEYKKSSNYEYKTIQLILDGLDSSVLFVDAYGELEKHKDEYIFFNTDHHWTGRGAYYAYLAFCKTAGFEPVAMADFERKQVKRKFLGSLYGITLDKRLKKNRDSLEYFKPTIPTRTYRYNKDSGRYEFSRLFSNTYNYANFIGGDHPMVRIESDVNTQKILVIKDSFGNAVAPFLTMHYGTVYVMDYRYFDINVKDFVVENQISAIMFLNNTFAANSKYTAYRGRYLLNLRTVPKPQPAPVSDSTTTTQDE